MPNKHPSNKEIKCIDACAIDAKIIANNAKTAKFAATYQSDMTKNPFFSKPSVWHFV